MRRNSDSHLDDIAKRFAATAPARPESVDPDSNTPEPRPSDFDDQTAAPTNTRSRKATAIIVLIALGALGAVATIALVVMRA